MNITNIPQRLVLGTAAACLSVAMLAGCNKKAEAPAAAAAPAAAPVAAAASESAVPKGSVTILEPADGATVSSPFKVKFGAEGVSIDPAGAIVANSGHHHLLINTGPIAEGQSIPMDDTHLHYGKAQTEADVTLAPGKYKLTAQLANGAHQSYGPALSKTIEITVK